MADLPPGSGGSPATLPLPLQTRRGRAYADLPLRRRVQHRAYDSAWPIGLLALAVALAVLLVLAGVTLTVAFITLIILSPLLLLTSPLWAPVAAVVFVSVAASFLGWCLAAVAALAAGSWAYRCLRRRQPVGAHRVDYPASGLGVGPASGVIVGYYAPEYHAPRRARTKDAAPGA
ncbi:hypothetical protein GUJ93_ZPchr0001g31729 [Zizania palustris]|uniref:Oleosin n=1 Tax=Zizania palustris TaxID=103762 RepID=A0A8J5RTM4_ZIZPA|nr:hypothetical protein GUJ93_ZPchr0001g31729 [Zizania palustris]